MYYSNFIEIINKSYNIEKEEFELTCFICSNNRIEITTQNDSKIKIGCSLKNNKNNSSSYINIGTTSVILQQEQKQTNSNCNNKKYQLYKLVLSKGEDSDKRFDFSTI